MDYISLHLYKKIHPPLSNFYLKINFNEDKSSFVIIFIYLRKSSVLKYSIISSFILSTSLDLKKMGITTELFF